MLCTNLEDPGFILGGGSGFVLEERLKISFIDQYPRIKIEKKNEWAPYVTFIITQNLNHLPLVCPILSGKLKLNC